MELDEITMQRELKLSILTSHSLRLTIVPKYEGQKGARGPAVSDEFSALRDNSMLLETLICTNGVSRSVRWSLMMYKLKVDCYLFSCRSYATACVQYTACGCGVSARRTEYECLVKIRRVISTTMGLR